MLEKPPRAYAQEIINAKSDKARAKLFKLVPDKFKDMVLTYWNIDQERKKYKKRKRK